MRTAKTKTAVAKKKVPAQKIRMAKLTPEEKETVINYDKSSDIATVWCADNVEINKLLRKGIKCVERTRFGAKFEINKKYITIRKPPKPKSSRVSKATSGEESKSDN